ncbi:hypothetical protein A2Y85_02790 [candidate division WOR-3 bacterium RBG_13_43_14]|uniref:Uncharacterized protein n=1 Tax=candidate division WOR-3 bacterium RBG_13_43_14 TaxID=1802590 RepID=A0A1F4U2T8_UNCW3|nr:MAG: hypothetical protein A2Y85_02790 [candidate division WOR-3 bacterium RBG_13_43_14]
MFIINRPLKSSEILAKYNNIYGTMIKAVVDTEKSIMAIDDELHSDLESYLISSGSRQNNLWGINLFLNKPLPEWIDYTALINIRPSMNNRSMIIQDAAIQKKIAGIVYRLVEP